MLLREREQRRRAVKAGGRTEEPELDRAGLTASERACRLQRVSPAAVSVTPRE
jgi:hypothetical protein